MKIIKKFQKNTFISKRSRILMIFSLSFAGLATLGISVAISYGMAQLKNKSYENTVEILNRLGKKINSISFNSQKISPFSTYSSVKEKWKEVKNKEKNADFFDFFHLENKKLQPYKLPSGIWADFTKIEPDDANQQFKIEFVLKSMNGSRIIQSDILKDTVGINTNSTFFLENFYHALEIELKNITPFSHENKIKSRPSIWLSTDFAHFVNSESTAEKVIEKIMNFFNFDFNSVLKNRNFSINYQGKLIYPYKIELLKNSENNWVKPSSLNSDILELTGKISFTDEAKKLFPKSFNTSATKNFTLQLFDSSTNKSAFASPQFFIKMPKLDSPQAKEFSTNSSENKTDISQFSIFKVYKLLKYRQELSLNSSSEAKKVLDSFLNKNLELNFGEFSDLDQQIKAKFKYQILVDKIQLGSDEKSAFILVPMEIFYPLDKKNNAKLTNQTHILLRNFKNSGSQTASVFEPANFEAIPIVNLKFSENSAEKNKKIIESLEPVAKSDLEKLLNVKNNEKIYNILTDSTKFNVTFPEKEILDSWVSHYDFPTLEEFSKRGLVEKIDKNGQIIQPFFQNNFEFFSFSKNLLNLDNQTQKKYLQVFFDSLHLKKTTEIEQALPENNQETPETPSPEPKTVAVLAAKNDLTIDVNESNFAENSDTESAQSEKKSTDEKSTDEKSPELTVFEQISENLRNLHSISAIYPLVQAIKKIDKSQENSDFLIDDFVSLFQQTYKNNYFVSQFDNFASDLDYKIVFVPNRDDEKVDDVTFSNSKSESYEKSNPGHKEESIESESEKIQENTPSSISNSDVAITNSVSEFKQNKVVLFDEKAKNQSQESENSISTLSKNSNSESFKLGYYYVFSNKNYNKIVFRTPIKSLNLQVFSDEKAKNKNDELDLKVLNFPQFLRKLEIDDSNFATGHNFNKKADEVLKAEFSSEDKDYEKTLISFKKIFGFDAFIKIYPFLAGNALVYKKDSVFTDAFGNLKIRFAVKHLTYSESLKVVFPNIICKETQAEPPKTEPKPATDVSQPTNLASLASPATSPAVSSQQSPNLKNGLPEFKPEQSESKYPLVFTVVKKNTVLRRN
ncbi:P97 family adhesin [Mycoplasma sp. 'Moose RK']|uniref:P97 family adhesin n=1 Tax=Mycoplasma sp. 'Moose RK' TaxID=2780095 RepID=UPI0018C20330|nr:hypothetical protein [Mycoplasma sp. 'Moose RK']MBG0731010.1 hypothetical protein [Mycoplasma sp. 'Moose RK']